MYRMGINFKKIIPFLGGAAQEVICIDLSGAELKLVHAVCSVAKKCEITDIANSSISDFSDEDIANAISGAVRDMKAKNAIIVNVIPSHQVITKNIEIPSTNPAEIREIINLQAGRHTPYSRDEIIVDYIDIGAYKHSYTKILLIIVARNVIKRQLEILDKAGLRMDKVAFAPEGLGWAALMILKLETMNSPVSVVHIDKDFTDFSVVFRNKVVFIRSISMGAHHLAEEKDIYELRFIDEVRQSLEAYNSENIERSPNMLVLTGAIEELGGLELHLKDALRLETRSVPYFRNLLTSNGALKVVSAARCLSFLNIITPLFALDEARVSLIPEEIKLKRSFEARSKDLIKAGAFTLAIFVLLCLISISKIYFKNAYLERLTAVYEKVNQEAQNLEKDYAQVSLVRNYLAGRGYSLEALSELHGIAPLELALDDIKLDGQGQFIIGGTAESMAVVFSFVDGMEKSKYFKDVKTKYASKRKVDSKDVTDFEIVCVLERGNEQ